MKQVIEEEINGFPDLHVAIEDVIAEGYKVCIRLKETGTHTGKFRGLAPTGKKINYTAITIWRIVNSKVVEGWGVYDMLDFYKQLGVIEYKGTKDFLTKLSNYFDLHFINSKKWGQREISPGWAGFKSQRPPARFFIAKNETATILTIDG